MTFIPLAVLFVPRKLNSITDSTQRSTPSRTVINKNDDAAKPKTVDLAEYYFSSDPSSSAFNWRSVALTLDGWDRLSIGHFAYLCKFNDTNNPDPQTLIISYGDIELFIDQGDRHKVMWGEEQGTLSGDTESINLPSDPIGLLRALDLTAHPLADDVIQLWKNLVAFLPKMELSS